MLDKARNVTQKCLIAKLQLWGAGGGEGGPRPTSSRLYRRSDSLEDVAIVTTNLQTSLAREKFLVN